MINIIGGLKMTKDKEEKNKKTGVNAYTLFLILILLILSENVLIQLQRIKNIKRNGG